VAPSQSVVIRWAAPTATRSEATIRAHSSPDSYSRGRGYYDRGAVIDIALRGDRLEGAVEGSQYTPYRVRVGFDAANHDGDAPVRMTAAGASISSRCLAALYDAKVEARLPLTSC
jgi:uncharacterized Zn finger protein